MLYGGSACYKILYLKTQKRRVCGTASVLLLVDNGSVFTENLVAFLREKKVDHRVMGFERISGHEPAKYDSFILSGRRKNDRQMNALNSRVVNHAISARKPLLGICYGAEILALTTGGTIRKMGSPQRGDGSVRVTQDNPLCGGTIRVYRSHSYEISQLGGSLVGLGRSDECKYELVMHKNGGIFGTQFHPEMTPDGLGLIERFTALNNF